MTKENIELPRQRPSAVSTEMPGQMALEGLSPDMTRPLDKEREMQVMVTVTFPFFGKKSQAQEAILEVTRGIRLQNFPGAQVVSYDIAETR